jgi:hypothetical protein
MLKLLSVGLCSHCDCVEPNTSTQNQNNTSASFTYDEGKGVKDTIIMDGPLSQIYSKALNIYFSKKPIEIQNQDSLSASMESAAIDTVVSQALIDHIELNEETNRQLKGLNIVSSNMDVVESPTAIIQTVYADKDKIDSEIDVIETKAEAFSKIGKPFVVFVGPNIGVDPDNTVEIFTELDYSDINKLNAFNISDKFKRSTEEFFEARGIKALVGFESLVEWLKTPNRGV